MYFGEDVSDQWQRKKQTKEQKRAAKRAKLDMNNYKSARDVMEERERAAVAGTKRTREQADDEENVNQEFPGEGLRRKKSKPSADEKQNSTSNNAAQEKPRTIAEKRAAKRAKRREQVEKSVKKRERQAARKQVAATASSAVISAEKPTEEDDADEADEVAEKIQVDGTLNTQLQDSGQDIVSSTASSPEPQSSTFSTPKSPQIHSPSSSTSSIQPPLDTAAPSKTNKPLQSGLLSSTNAKTESSIDSANSTIKTDQPYSNSKASTSKPLKPSAEELRLRLASRIEALRTARKADGLNGQPARSRQELLESRRRKEEERRAHKKELRRLAKEEEARKQDEEMARRFSPGGSGSLLGSPMSPLPSDAGRNSFSFGRVAFGDGSQLDEKQARKACGPSDAATALKASQAKQNRIDGLDAEKRATIAEKDMWANANSRARGEKVRDDTSLLKKALKRQQKKKSRSEKEWKERNEGVQKAGDARQRKREDNLKKRKEEKGAGKGRKGHGKNTSSKGKGNVIKRPGFEGTFRGRTGGGGGGSMKKNSSNI